MAVDKSQRVYRVDKFIVPAEARDEFLGRVQKTHELLQTQPGFIQDMVLEKSTGLGEFNFVTVVEWENTDVTERVGEAVQALHQQMGFNPQEVFARLGIKADIANYTNVGDEHVSL